MNVVNTLSTDKSRSWDHTLLFHAPYICKVKLSLSFPVDFPRVSVPESSTAASQAGEGGVVLVDSAVAESA